MAGVTDEHDEIYLEYSPSKISFLNRKGLENDSKHWFVLRITRHPTVVGYVLQFTSLSRVLPTKILEMSYFYSIFIIENVFTTE